MSEKKNKKPLFKRWWFWVIVVIVAGGVIGSNGSKNTPKAGSDVPTSNQEKTEEKWEEVIRFEGKSIKDTETFKISSKEWRIVWDTKPGDMGGMNFQIYVYNANGSMESVAANVIGEANDTSYMRGKGEYYFTIVTAQPYTIIVEEKK
ncbi:hypothetical protein KQI88_15950 [Alkaliphilus sp. MSJ-5]|uniref:Uncharacterized protein n=1 Tax=Alkaliphilus flagellatus TaxID=2841507 RepID=A0ABS6G957_9FIRM|nr:hypothetical protein [Alkaliphilus flagellatus]MBU5677911.1 hypothetical protein [Alkaliphilus flagellatus]